MYNFLRKIFGCETKKQHRLPPFTKPYHFVYVSNKSYPDLFSK